MHLHPRPLRPSPPLRERGFSMIEILITIIVMAFALLGLAGFVNRATASSVEATQRARAALMVGDMANRIANNKDNATAYAGATIHGAASQDCKALVNAAQIDLCQWNNLLAGNNDGLASGAAAALTFRGCITRPNAADPVFVITVAWAATVPGVPPADGCAIDTFGDDSFRRILRTQVRIATLAA